MRRLVARYTNWFRDAMRPADTMFSAISATNMQEAVDQVAVMMRSNPEAVYDHTEVEHDRPDGRTTRNVYDFGDWARDRLRQIVEREETDCPMPGAVSSLVPSPAPAPIVVPPPAFLTDPIDPIILTDPSILTDPPPQIDPTKTTDATDATEKPLEMPT
jgi:hypothetical protein